MNLGTLIVRNVFRNKRRTLLTVVSIGFSLFLLIALYSFLDMLFNPPASRESALRLAVRRSTAITEQMPMSYEAKLSKVPHVLAVMPLQWVGGVYKEPKNFFPNFAVDSRLFEMFPEIATTEQAKRDFAKERMAAIAGVDIMKRFGWRLGDRITLKGTIFPVDLELKIVGTYRYEFGSENLYFRFDYFNEALGSPNSVGAFWLRADSGESVPGIIDTVDTMFRNSAAETKTETEKGFVLNFISMLGNVKFMVGSIATVVVFTMLLVVASTMAMTIRERMREVAIVKTLGFTRELVLVLVVGESLFISLLGVGTGFLMSHAMGYVDIYSLTQGFIPVYKPQPQIYVVALVTGVAIGLVSGFIPGLQASKLTITRAMRQLE